MATGAVKPPARRNSSTQAAKFGVGDVEPVARQAAITSPTGGATIDTQSRAAIDLIITRLEAFGLVVPN